jgi:TRAP-type C4-dicarboxylate transport system substrate-binding protein
MKMVKSRYIGIVVIFVLLVAIIVSSCTQPTAAPEEPIKIIFASASSAEIIGGPTTTEIFEEIEQETNGRVQFEQHWGGSLLGATDLYDGVVQGVCDMAMVGLTYVPGRFPLIEIVELPLGYTKMSIANQVVDDVLNKYHFEELNDTHMWSHHAIGSFYLGCTKPVRKLDDFKGLKLRSMSSAAPQIEALGAAPVMMPIFEAYEAMMRGLVDGTITGASGHLGIKLYEVENYATEMSFMAPTMVFPQVISKDKWNSLPPDIQEIFNEKAEDYKIKSGEWGDREDAKIFDIFEQYDVEVIYLPQEEQDRISKVMEEVIEAEIAKKEAMGLPAGEVVSFIKERLAELNK